LDILAIPALCRLLPKYSSQDFSNQLLPHLREYPNTENPIWKRVRQAFYDATRSLRPTSIPRILQGLSTTHHQKRIWKLHQLNQTAYNFLTCYGLKGKVTLAQIRTALHKLAKEEEVLRTVFSETSGSLVQLISGEVSKLPVFVFLPFF